jgi:hypothetical protein
MAMKQKREWEWDGNCCHSTVTDACGLYYFRMRIAAALASQEDDEDDDGEEGLPPVLSTPNGAL